MTPAVSNLPDIAEADFERYLVHDRLEIVSILRKLQTRNDQLAVSWSGTGFTLTVILATNPEFEELVFDCGRDPQANRAILAAGHVTFSATVDGVKVQFVAHHVDATVFEGHPALRIRLPELVLRVQRRESFRVPASLTCQLAIDARGAVRILEMRIADLSLGGLALVSDRNYVRLEGGQRLENCRIDLGSLGALAVTLEVRNLAEIAARNGLSRMRVGCQFANLSRSTETLISRYIAQKERERLTRD